MIDFLKRFFTGEQILPVKQRDVLVLDGFPLNDDNAQEEQSGGGCGSGGCGSCGCG